MNFITSLFFMYFHFIVAVRRNPDFNGFTNEDVLEEFFVLFELKFVDGDGQLN